MPYVEAQHMKKCRYVWSSQNCVGIKHNILQVMTYQQTLNLGFNDIYVNTYFIPYCIQLAQRLCKFCDSKWQKWGDRYVFEAIIFRFFWHLVQTVKLKYFCHSNAHFIVQYPSSCINGWNYRAAKLVWV